MALVEQPGSLDGVVCLHGRYRVLESASDVRSPGAAGRGLVADVAGIQRTTDDLLLRIAYGLFSSRRIASYGRFGDEGRSGGGSKHVRDKSSHGHLSRMSSFLVSRLGFLCRKCDRMALGPTVTSHF